MKKSLVAILAALSMICTLTACGEETSETETSDSPDDSSSVSETSNSSVADVSDDVFIDLYYNFCVATNNGDAEAITRCCMPDATYGYMETIGMIEYMTDSLGLEDSVFATDLDRDDIKVISIEQCSDEEIEYAEHLYSYYDLTYKIMAELGMTCDMLMGIEDMPDDLMEAYIERLTELEYETIYDIPLTVDFDDFVCVTFYWPVDGEETEETLAIYKEAGTDTYKLDSMGALENYEASLEYEY